MARTFDERITLKLRFNLHGMARISWCYNIYFLIYISGIDSCMRKQAKVEVTCPEHRTETADRKASSALVSWTRNDFKTESTHPIRGIYQTIPIYGASANVEREFEEGSHYVEYKAVDEGGRFDSCSFKVHVKVIKCDRLYNPEYGFITCDAGNVYGSQCTVSCIPGYSVKGLADISCQTNGSWSSAMPACIAQTCPDPGTPIHGDRYCTTITHAYGSICSFSCSRGYHLVGSSRIICEATENGTRWTEVTPSCQKITPPKPEACPQDIKETTGASHAEIHKPEIRFVTNQGTPAPYACSHFGNRDSYNFTVGTHLVTCTAFDPHYESDATATCTFRVIIKPNPCRPLSKPRNGKLMCSRSEGASIAPPYDTSCELHCNESYMLPRQDEIPVKRFSCDRSGNWKPHHYVPSCVKPKRPQELKLPSEIYYTSTNCTNVTHLTDIRAKFQAAVQTTIRMQVDCERTPGDCIVDKVETSCQYQSDPIAMPSRQNSGKSSNLPRNTRHTATRASLKARRTPQYRFQIGGHSSIPSALKSHEEQSVVRFLELSSSFVVPIQFDFGTRIPEIGGEWPDEHHQALNRLYGMYDHFERQVNERTFQLGKRISGVNMTEVVDSLTFAKERAQCELGYTYDSETLFCVPCGPGTYYNYTKDKCKLCDIGKYQEHEAKLYCTPCPTGTMSLDRGASAQSQCVEIDECDSSPCENNGICEDEHASYTCICKPGYAGPSCGDRVYNCTDHACQNGGTCIPKGDNNYTCECRYAYSGEYCQYHSIHGNWGRWTEWSVCSQSCGTEGGIQTRQRLCDSPPPSNGGEPCLGANLMERVCNDFACPECNRLRRPYGGRISCNYFKEDDLNSCTIKCNTGYAFSDPVLPVYTCGRNTSYLWPHQSPDNPRCILPSCTKIQEPMAEVFAFEASVSTSACTPELRRQLGNELRKRSVEYTTDLLCLQDGSCELDSPEIGECQAEEEVESTSSSSSSSSHRKRRSLEETSDGQSDIKFKVSLMYKGIGEQKRKQLNEGLHTPQLEMKAELSNLGKRLIKEVKENKMYLNINGQPMTIKADSMAALATPLCDKGTVPCAEDDCCVECGIGTYYSESTQSCILCPTGFYQPQSKQLTCIQCSGDHTTYGRGAVYDIECYKKGDAPPTIPANYIPGKIALEDSNNSTLVLAVCLPIVGFVILAILFFVLYKCRRRKIYRAAKRRKDSESKTKNSPEEQISFTAFNSEKG